MSQNSTSSIRVVNVVSTALLIYRDNFNSYIAVAITATLWFLLPFLALIPTLLFFTYRQANISTSNWLLLILVWILLFIFCTSKSIVNSAIIGRLVFGLLTNKPETVSEARRSLAPKIWFFSKVFLLFLIIFGVWLSLFLWALIALGLYTSVFLIFHGQDQNFIIFIDLVIFVILLSFSIRLLSRFLIIYMPLSVESNMSATQSLGRSFKLTKKYLWHIFVLLLLAALVALPIAIMSYIISGIFCNILSIEAPFFSILIPTLPKMLLIVNLFILPFSMRIWLLLGVPVILVENGLTEPSYWLAYLIFYDIVFCLSSILLLPFWQSIKALIYYDLRNREAQGLQ
ncbi:MAG: hypothetical protein AB4080_02205 [Trichodesmium sp.]